MCNLFDDSGRLRDIPPNQAEIEQRHEEAVERVANLVKTNALSPFLSLGLQFDQWALRQRGIMSYISGTLYLIKKSVEFCLNIIVAILAIPITPLRKYTPNFKDENFKKQSEYLVKQLSAPTMEILYFKLLDIIVESLNPEFNAANEIRKRKPKESVEVQ